MSIAEMRRQPVLSLLSGPAAGASAALHLSGLSEVVFIEVGGTSTDITLISEGRVRHRYAAVGGQRLMVPSLDLRTVPVGGGSMLRADRPLFGPRSAHIAGLPYLFQAVAAGKRFASAERWTEPGSRVPYTVARLDDGSLAAITLTDLWLSELPPQLRSTGAFQLGLSLSEAGWAGLQPVGALQLEQARSATLRLAADAILELARSHQAQLRHFTLVGGGGGAPCVIDALAQQLQLKPQLIPHHAVISAIGAALAVTCVSLSRSCSSPTAGEIGGLVREVEEKLREQGAERVSTDYEYDPQRQVLTVTGRGSRPYEQAATPKTPEELARIAEDFLGGSGVRLWDGGELQLWQPDGEKSTAVSGDGGRPTFARRPKHLRLGLALDSFGRSLWLGRLAEFFPVAPGQRDSVLQHILDTRTQYSDGGPLLPGLALLCAGRFIPLDQLGSAELIGDILRLEALPAAAPACFILRS